MEAVAAAAARQRSIPLVGRLDPPALGAWLMSFSLVFYLALEGGGYDPVVRGQIGVAVWWIVLLGAIVGVLPAARIGWRGWTGLALLGAFVLWTALSIPGSESQERTVAELGKVAAYLGVFVLALSVVGRTAARHALNGLACAIGLIALLAVLSRLQPQFFPDNDLARFFGESSARKLAFPFNYWNALAAFIAIGLPLVLRAATSARSLGAQAVAAAAVPIMVLGVFFSVSRGGAIALAAAAVAWILLTPDRLPKLLTAVTCGAGAAILLAAADQRDALQTGIAGALAREQGDSLLAMMAVVCLGVALVQVAVGLVVRHGKRPAWTVLPRKRAPFVFAAVAVVAVLIAISAGVPSTLSQQWTDFKTLNAPAKINAGEDAFARLQSLSGNGRYQYWLKAADAAQTRPLGGIGSGTFEFWWARNSTIDGFIRDAHSLYLETFAELGLVGLALLVGLLGWALTVGVQRSVGRLSSEHRGVMAAATAGCVGFAIAAAGEWIWELAAIAAALLVLVAVILAGGRRLGAPARDGGSTVPRIVLVGAAILGLVAVSIPLAGTTALRESQAAARTGDLDPALAQARSAQAVQPYGATAQVQKALVLERAGDVNGAAAAIRTATEREPTNWRPWLIRSRIEAARQRPQAAVQAFRRARALNPRSALFKSP